jgi:hypothetical protein
MTSLALETPGPSIFLAGLRRASPLLWWLSLGFLAAFITCTALSQFDTRLFNGISVWVKPAKFFLSLAVHMLTLCFGLTLLPSKLRTSWPSTLITGTMASMALFEMTCITFRAARGEASHFNTSSELAGLLYSLMGAGAALMMVVTFVLGLQILRHGKANLITRATGWGFMTTAILTLVVGFTLGGMGSHWIGGDQTDATGLPLFGWSTTGGDLRPAHFAGLHLMQVLPFAALTGSRTAVWISGLFVVFATAAAYLLALNGIPLIRL